MDSSRRDFLRLSTGAAAGALLTASQGAAQAQGQAVSAADASSMAVVPTATGALLRLVTFAPDAAAAARVGAVTAAGRVVDLAAAAKTHGMALPFDAASMVSLIAAGPTAVEQVRKLVAEASPEDGPAVTAVRLLAPIPTPARNVYAVGWNYLEHFEEGRAMRLNKADLPEHPVFFTKGVHTVNGPYDPIPFDPAVSTMIDWEGELAVV
ncbi:MAG TPA: fumarylacetoacetate hydrolase family protein, partial [Stellaceae bacterium]